MADQLFVQLSFAVSAWQSRPRWRCGVLMLLLIALVGCEKKTQVNYSRWQGVRPDFEIQLDVDAAAEAPVKEAGEHKVTTNSAIRFHGKVLLDPQDDSPGTTLVVEIGKPSGKSFLVFNSGSAVVAPASKSDGPFEVFVKAPAPGTFALRVRVENKDRGRGKLIVAKAAKKP